MVQSMSLFKNMSFLFSSVTSLCRRQCSPIQLC